MDLRSKSRDAKKESARCSDTRLSPAGLRLDDLRPEPHQLPDPFRMLHATAAVYRSIAELSTGAVAAVLCAAADDLETHAERLSMIDDGAAFRQ